MLIETVMSLMLCGASIGLPEDECETVSTHSWEARTIIEANQDWAECLISRETYLKFYDEVECDQDVAQNLRVSM